MTREISKKISDSKKGVPVSKESRIKRSKTQKGTMPWNAGKSNKPTKISDLPTVVILDAVTVEKPISEHPLAGKQKTQAHKDAISKSHKELYKTAKGDKLKKERSTRLKKFYESPEGIALRKKLSAKCGRPQKKAVAKSVRKVIYNRYMDGELMKDLALEYNVSRASIYRYIKEFS